MYIKFARVFLLLLLNLTLLGCLSDAESKATDSSNLDRSPPIVTIASPSNDQYVGSLVSISADASDESGIAFVEFLADGDLIDTDELAPYEFSWSPTVGSHSISVRAVDSSAGANSATATINVTRLTTQIQDDWNDSDFSTVIDVGPGFAIGELEDVAWESMPSDTLVKVHWRDAPYRAKFAINTAGTESSPVVLLGISDAGRKPVISGEDAVTRPELSYSNRSRSLIKIGGSNLPAGQTASWIYIDNLVLRGASPTNSFTDRDGSTISYSSNAASVHINIGDNIFVQNCEVTDSGNGIFSGFQSANVVIRGNYIHGNGVVGSDREHNTYTESMNITYEYNLMEPLRAGADGENLKDRSSGSVIRYNWIVGGNRQLDLVDSDHSEIYGEAAYRTTHVYGNILIEPNGAGNRNIVHYGGDLSGRQSTYRKGTLHFYHNTVVSTRSDRAVLFGPSSNDETIDARNNIIYSSSGGSNIAITSGRGMIDLRNNWLPRNWVTANGSLNGVVNDLGNIEGTSPGFADESARNYTLLPSADPVDAGGVLAPGILPLVSQYVKHMQITDREFVGDADIGAFESSSSVATLTVSTPASLPDATQDQAYSSYLSAIGGVPPYSWTIQSGAMPPGISLNSSSGQISGTTSVVETFDVTILVDDSQNTSASKSFTLNVRDATEPPPSGLLDTYSSASASESLNYVSADLSGITYVPDTNTFLMIQNSGGRIWEVDTSFNLIRTIRANGFGDAEDIVYLGDFEFGIIIEAAVLYIGTIPILATSISPSDFQRVTFDSASGNNGYEGIAYDFNTDTFWSVKEFGPRKIVSFQRPIGSSDVTVVPDVPFDAQTLPADDLSAVHFDSRTGNLLILSHESHKIMEVTPDGTVLSQLRMADSTQHEGLALDSSFNFLVTSEPNRYRRYSQL